MARIILWIALALFFAPGSAAQDSISATLETELEAIGAAVAELRELRPRERSAVEFLDQRQVHKRMEDLLHHFYPEDWISTYHHFLTALDLVEKDIDLGALLLAFLAGNIGGYYDFNRDTMVVILRPGASPADRLALPEKLIYAHEFVHALQDQHFDLAAFRERTAPGTNFDAELARLALVEGDAMLTEQLYLQALLLKGQATVDSVVNLAHGEPPPLEGEMPPLEGETPPIIQQAFFFPYLEGLDFALSLYGHSGLPKLNRAFTEYPPETSEQILHPERYFAGEGAKAVDLPDDSDLIDEGWARLYDGAVGEFYLRRHLDTQLLARYVEKMADGWGGDRLRIYGRADAEELMWVWYQVWDRARDAQEFADYYPRFLDERFDPGARDGQCWGGETSRCFARVGETETRISMAGQRSAALELLNM